jgi:hypothetical protein
MTISKHERESRARCRRVFGVSRYLACEAAGGCMALEGEGH